MTPSIVTLLFSLALIPTVISNPVVHIRDSLITLPIAKRFADVGVTNILARDQARARRIVSNNLEKRNRHRDSSIDVTNAGSIYTASVGVGSPPTYYDLIIDTGSSNTWGGADLANPFVRSTTTQDTGNEEVRQHE